MQKIQGTLPAALTKVQEERRLNTRIHLTYSTYRFKATKLL